MLEEEFAVALELRLVAVVDGKNRRVRTQPQRHLPRHRGARLGIGTRDRGDDEMRRRALAQLLDEQALRGARASRQERREIRGVAGADGDDGGNERGECPDQRACHAGTRHGTTAAPMVRVEVSPSL